MKVDPDDPSGFEATRVIRVAAAVIVVVVAMGFLTGTRQATRPRSVAAAADVAKPEKQPSYAELRGMRRGPNAGMVQGAFARLTADAPGVNDPVVRTEAERDEALRARASRRAYDGAPPTIPHAIQQGGPPDCLTCHRTGARVDGKTAPRMSHQAFESCTQCHVVGSDPRPTASTPPAPENLFVGAPSPSRGERAWAGAPPTIPHSTTMRTECASCHGTLGLNGMRSTHPYRQSCTQCHATSAVLDQRGPQDLGAGGPRP